MSPRPLPRRLIVLGLIAVVLILGITTVGIIGLLRGPNSDSTPQPEPTGTTAPAPAATIRPTGDAETFARRVAAALFDWDTTLTRGPDRIVETLIEVGDPTGEDVPGLYADMVGYLPTAAQWAQLREFATTQRLDIAEATVPASWAGIAADPVNAIPDGVVAITIDGTRVREGGWPGEPRKQSRSPVVFTLFLACPPAADTCALLRLSVLGEALR